MRLFLSALAWALLSTCALAQVPHSFATQQGYVSAQQLDDNFAYVNNAANLTGTVPVARLPTGTSGASLCLLNATCTWSGAQTFNSNAAQSFGGANPLIAPTQFNGYPTNSALATAGIYSLNGAQFNNALQQVSSWIDNTGTEHTYAGFFQTRVFNGGSSGFTASQSGSNLTVSAVSAGSLVVGQTIYGSGVPSLETIVSQTSGTTGGAGVYVVTGSATVASESMTGQNQGYGWGLQVDSYAYGAYSQAVGQEMDFGTQNASNGSQAIGLGLNAAGTTGSNYVVGLQFSSLGSGGQMTNGISFNEYGGIGVFINSLIQSQGAVNSTHGIDFSSASFGADAFKTAGWIVDNAGQTHITGTVAGGKRNVFYETSGSKRWAWSADSAAEGGSNTGSGMALYAYDDSGNFLSNPIYVSRQHGQVAFNGVVRLANTTVANLATIDPSPAIGDTAMVTDATACTFATAVTGGGSVKCPVYYDGAWKAG